jgi:hypothetical protein
MYLIQHEVSKKFPSQSNSSLHTFFFTKFICPAILFPNQNDSQLFSTFIHNQNNNNNNDVVIENTENELNLSSNSTENELFSISNEDFIRKELLLVCKLMQSIGTLNSNYNSIQNLPKDYFLLNSNVISFLEEARDIVDHFFLQMVKEMIDF